MAVDNSTWDGNRAMSECSTAADYDKVCAGTKAGDPSLRSSHALPHHYLSKAPTPNADGVRAALQRFSATQGLTNSAEARRHLEAHMTSIQAARAATGVPDMFPEPTDVAGLLTHLGAEDHALQGAGWDGFSYLELHQIHLGAHLKEMTEHWHPELDLDGHADNDDLNSNPPTNDLYRAIYPGVEIRDISDGQPVLAGHFATFDEPTEIDSVFEGRFIERIARGAFVDSFRSITPKVLFQHGKDPEIGDKVLGSPVTVREDDRGAAYEVPLFPSVPPLIVDGLRAGAYGASFRFHVEDQVVNKKPGRSQTNPEGLPERTITKARVSEFGPVTFPAYAGATAGIRSLSDQFRPPDRNAEIAAMAREHPKELAAVIQRALKGSEPEPSRPKAPVESRFRSREEYLEWLMKS